RFRGRGPEQPGTVPPATKGAAPHESPGSGGQRGQGAYGQRGGASAGRSSPGGAPGHEKPQGGQKKGKETSPTPAPQEHELNLRLTAAPGVIRGRFALPREHLLLLPVARGSQRPWLQQLRNLHRVQSSAFEQLIARYPKGKPVLKSAIDADAAHLTIVFSGDA